MHQLFTRLVIIPLCIACTLPVFAANNAALRYGKPFGCGMLPGDFPLYPADQALDVLPHSVRHGYVAKVGRMPTRSHPWDLIA